MDDRRSNVIADQRTLSLKIPHRSPSLTACSKCDNAQHNSGHVLLYTDLVEGIWEVDILHGTLQEGLGFKSEPVVI